MGVPFRQPFSDGITATGSTGSGALVLATDPTLPAGLTIYGNANLGDAAGDAHVIRGTITAQDATAANLAATSLMSQSQTTWKTIIDSTRIQQFGIARYGATRGGTAASSILGSGTTVIDAGYEAGTFGAYNTAVTMDATTWASWAFGIAANNSVGGGGRIKGISVLDKDDVGAAIDLWFLRSNVVFGAANAAPSITDAAAEAVLKYVSLTPDKDLGVCKFGQVACTISFDIDSPKMYIAAVTQGTPTYTAAGLVITVDIELEVG